MQPIDLESLKEIFRDKRTWIDLGVVTQVETSPDAIRTMVKMLDDNQEIMAVCGFASSGPDCGIIQEPAVDDLVLVAFSEGQEDLAYIISRLSSTADYIPLRVQLFKNAVVKSRSGQTLDITSDTRVNVGRGGLIEESEPLVLGNVLLDALGDMFSRLDTLMSDISSGPVGIGNEGYPVPCHPTLIAKIAATKALLTADVLQYLSLPVTNIVSQIGFTER